MPCAQENTVIWMSEFEFLSSVSAWDHGKSMLSARLRFMLSVALIVYLHLCYREFTAQSCLKVSEVASSCEAARLLSYQVTVRYEDWLTVCLAYAWPASSPGQVNAAEAVRVNASIGMSPQLVSFAGLMQSSLGKIFLPWMQVHKMLTCKTLGRACAKCQTACVCL